LGQISAFPVRLVQLDPANLGTADAAWFAEGANGVEYCVKTVARTPAVPAAEFICHTLAHTCGIPVPQFDIVELPDGSLAFGSAWEGSAADKQHAIQVLTGARPGRQLVKCLSRIFAFDLFVHNVDRHLGNFLCVAGRTPGHTVKAYDFSRAFTACTWPLPQPPMPSTTRTLTTARLLREIHGFDETEAKGLLDRIDSIPFASFKRLVDGLPLDWLNSKSRSSLLKWWASDRTVRTKEISEGLKNGSFL
jgi:hypothetical protein